MSLLVQKRAQTTKPTYPRVDKSQPLSRGLGMVVCPYSVSPLQTIVHDEPKVKNLITGDIGEFNNDATVNVKSTLLSREKSCLTFNGNNANSTLNKVVFPSYNPSNTTSSFSVTFRMRVRLVSGSFGRLITAKQGNFTSAGWEIGVNNVDDTQFFIRGGSSTITNIATNANFTENKWETFTVVFNGTTVSVYQNGVFLSSGTITVANAATAGIGLGNPPTAQNERTISMDQAFIYIHERILSDGEIKSLHKNPYQIFESKTQTIFFEDAVAAGFQPAWARNTNQIIGMNQ